MQPVSTFKQVMPYPTLTKHVAVALFLTAQSRVIYDLGHHT